jgi:hypothetical protein
LEAASPLRHDIMTSGESRPVDPIGIHDDEMGIGFLAFKTFLQPSCDEPHMNEGFGNGSHGICDKRDVGNNNS